MIPDKRGYHDLVNVSSKCCVGWPLLSRANLESASFISRICEKSRSEVNILTIFPPPPPPGLFSWFRLFFRVWHVFLENSFRSSVIRFSLVKLLPSSFRLILLRIRDRAYVAPTIIRRRKSRVHNREESPMTHRRKVREKFCKNSRNRLYRRSDVLSLRESREVFDDIQK